jgi:hypothetical protein
MNGPCGVGFDINKHSTVTEWPVSGVAIHLDETRPHTKYTFKAALTNDTTVFDDLSQPVVTSRFGDFCVALVLRRKEWIGLNALVQIRQETGDVRTYWVSNSALFHLHGLYSFFVAVCFLVFAHRVHCLNGHALTALHSVQLSISQRPQQSPQILLARAESDTRSSLQPLRLHIHLPNWWLSMRVHRHRRWCREHPPEALGKQA